MLKVLLADDEPIILQGLIALIDWEKEGCEIAGTVPSGRLALEFLRQNKVDLILADIQMPEMSGIELLESVRTRRLSDASFVILSGHNDFAYAQKAIRWGCMDYILKPVQKNELLAVVRKVAGMRRSHETQQRYNRQMEKAHLARSVIALLSGKYDAMNLEEIQNQLRLTQGIRYIDIEVDVQAMPGKLDHDEMRLLQRELYRACLDYLGEERSDYCFFDIARQQEEYDIGFLYCREMAGDAGEDAENRFLHDFLEALRGRMNVPVVMFVGNAVDRLTDLQESYRTAMVVKSFRDFNASRTISWYEKEVVPEASGPVLCKELLDALVAAIEQNDGDAIDSNAERLYEEINRMAMDAEMVNLNISYLLFQLIHLAISRDDKVNQEEIMQYISDNAFDRSAMRGSEAHFKWFARQYAEYLIQLSSQTSRGILPEIEREIQERYAENLTLKELGKKYFVNSAYLGQLFHKKYNQSFRDYLNSVRIEKAAALLLHSDKKIYEIAESVGYRDLDYFINRFIASKGCTPARFRKQNN